MLRNNQISSNVRCQRVNVEVAVDAGHVHVRDIYIEGCM